MRRFLLLSTLFLGAANTAYATDIGSSSKFGIGAETGYPMIANLSMKVWFNDQYGLSMRAGANFFDYFETAVRFEGVAYRGQWFDWADLPFIWHVGLDLGFEMDDRSPDWQVGPEAGFGAALQFSSFNGEVFVQHGIGIYPVTVWDTVEPRVSAGFRYYF